jgi:hypothetical protein
MVGIVKAEAGLPHSKKKRPAIGGPEEIENKQID